MYIYIYVCVCVYYVYVLVTSRGKSEKNNFQLVNNDLWKHWLGMAGSLFTTMLKMLSTIVKVKFDIPEQTWIVQNYWTCLEKECASISGYFHSGLSAALKTLCCPYWTVASRARTFPHRFMQKLESAAISCKDTVSSHDTTRIHKMLKATPTPPRTGLQVQ